MQPSNQGRLHTLELRAQIEHASVLFLHFVMDIEHLVMQKCQLSLNRCSESGQTAELIFKALSDALRHFHNLCLICCDFEL